MAGFDEYALAAHQFGEKRWAVKIDDAVARIDQASPTASKRSLFVNISARPVLDTWIYDDVFDAST
eukprot:SAG11_NODE_12149_length_719_cov_1.625806_1_plen_66_part_00